MTNKTELLQKIKALADRGVDGERESAQALLSRLMKQYGISEAELEEERRETAWFRYSQETERRLLNQIIYMVTGKPGFGCVGSWSGRKRKEMGADCTAAERLEIEANYEFFKAAMEAELEIFYSAFSSKNHLFPSEDKVKPIFDVPEKQRADWFVKYMSIPEGISFDDTDAGERIIEQGNLSIVYAGKTLKPLQTRRGLVFIESRYLSPMSDYMDVLELYERFTPSGTPYIVAKAGFMLQAVIMPYDAINEQFVKRLQELAKQCAVSLDLREREREAADDPAQFRVDPSTGEIVEPESGAGEDD